MSGEKHLTPDESRKRFIAEWDHKVVRLEDQLDKAVKILAIQIQSLENSLMDKGFAYKLLDADPTTMRVLKDLTSSLDTLSSAQIRLGKAAKERAAKMTPDEERLAVLEYLRAMEHSTRGDFIRRLIDYHNEQAARMTPSQAPIVKNVP